MQQVLFDVKKEENEYKQFDEELNKVPKRSFSEPSSF